MIDAADLADVSAAHGLQILAGDRGCALEQRTDGSTLGTALPCFDIGELLVVGDAAATEAILDGDSQPLLAEDEHLSDRSVREIRAYRRLTPKAVIVPGHDSEAWNGLAGVYR
jgi:hypothetical protein